MLAKFAATHVLCDAWFQGFFLMVPGTESARLGLPNQECVARCATKMCLRNLLDSVDSRRLFSCFSDGLVTNFNDCLLSWRQA